MIQRFSGGHLGFGVWIGVLELVRSGNVVDTVKSMQGNA